MKNKSFEAKRCTLTAEQHLNFPAEKVFPQLCPIREYDWISYWKCDLLYSESGYAEQDCIFATEDPHEIWVTSRYEPNKLIEFIRVSGKWAIRYTITLTNADTETTTLKWKQVITGFNEEGNRYVESSSNDEFSKKIKGLENLLHHYLATGEMLKAKDES